MRKWQKNETKLGHCSGFFPPIPLLWYCFVKKQYQRRGIGGKNTTSRGSWFFAAKTLDFESSIEVLKELGSLYKMDQL